MKIKISKQKRVIKEQKEKLDEVVPAVVGSAIASFAPKIIKGVASLIGDDDAEENAEALVDKSQLDPIVIKSPELSKIRQLLSSIEAKISEISPSAQPEEPAPAQPAQAEGPAQSSGRDV